MLVGCKLHRPELIEQVCLPINSTLALLNVVFNLCTLWKLSFFPHVKIVQLVGDS